MQNLGREGLQVRSGCLDFYASKLCRLIIVKLSKFLVFERNPFKLTMVI